MSDASQRPTIAPDALAAIVSAAPPRAVKKLDSAPQAASSWAWQTEGDATTITTDGGELVTLTHPGGVIQGEAMRCTCLLSPRCFHVIAVATVLPIASPPWERPAQAASDAPSAGAPAVAQPDRAIVEAATHMLDTLARVLARGLSAVGALERAEVLRAVHRCRILGLHRLARRALAFVESARALRERDATFDLDEAVRALGDAAVTAHKLRRGATDRETIGVARRGYEPVGSMRLIGVACEPVVTRSGYAGIVSYVTTDDGVLFSVEDVAPGDAGRALAAYRATVRLGDAALTHKELSRGGLFVQSATASPDRRLGSGAAVAAVSAAGAKLDEAPIAARFDEPLAAQIARAVAGPGDEHAPRSNDLLFLRGTIVGPAPSGFAFLSGEVLFTVGARADDSVFASNENLRLLRGASGAELLLIGHAIRTRARHIEAITLGGPGLALSDKAEGRLHLAFDKLARGHLRTPPVPAPLVALVEPRASDVGADPLDALHRRVARLALGGRATLTTRVAHDIALEAAALDRSLAPTAKAALQRLFSASAQHAQDPRLLLDAWTSAWVVTSTMRSTLATAAWRSA